MVRDMLREDNSGYVEFPLEGPEFTKKGGKTLVYLVAYEVDDFMNEPYVLSNSNLVLRGDFISDDMSMKSKSDFENSLALSDDRYFPNNININGSNLKSSIPLTASICIGWSDMTFNFREGDLPWCANFRDLTREGRKLYYSIKKLHNTKEVRILTFNNVQ